MRTLIISMLLLLIAASFATETVSVMEDMGGLRVTRSLTTFSVDGTSYRTSPDSGVVAAEYGSIVTISVRNMRTESVLGLSLTEDLAWIPATKTITFSILPQDNDGRKATWELGTLAPSSEAKITYTVDGALNPENQKTIPLPKITYQENRAVLSATRAVRQGETVQLTLSTSDGRPAQGAKIMVDTPAGEIATISTDLYGRASFTPVDSGFYTYSVAGYVVQYLPTTEVEQVLLANPQTAAATSHDDSGVLAAISGIWPLVGGVMLLGLVAFALFAYLNTSPKEEESYSAESYTPSSAKVQAENTDGMKYSISYGGASGSDDDVRQQTKALLERRKEESAQSQEKEETRIMLPKEQNEKETVSDASDAAEREVFSQGKEEHEESLPNWMKGGEENYEGESAVVDDETIQKTIIELEELRAQLKGRQETRMMPGDETSRHDDEEEIAPKQKQHPLPLLKKPRVFPKKGLAKKKNASSKKRR